MKKTVFLLTLSFLLLHAHNVFAQGKQTLSFEPGRTTLKHDMKMLSSLADGESINAELLLQYDRSSQNLSLQITPKKGSYDKVFIPMKVYGKSDLKQSVKFTLRGKARFARPFKNGLVFGIGPAISYTGATAVDAVTGGLDKELLAPDEHMVLHLRVDNPEKGVQIKLRGISAVRMLESASGKMKYLFNYTVDDAVFDVKLPLDPCDIDEMAAIASDARSLYNDALAQHRELAKAAGMKETEKCKNCKDDFEKSLSLRLSALKDRYLKIGGKCAKVDKILNEIQVVFNDADTIKCQRKAIVRNPVENNSKATAASPCPSNIASTLDNEVKKFDRLVSKISGGRGDINTRKECETLIMQFEERVAHLDEKCKSKQDVRKNIASFENLKQLYRRATTK